MRWRFFIGALVAMASYALLASVDGLEFWIETTAEYEYLELDELPLIFIFLFGWYAWVLFEQNRERKQMLTLLRAEVSEKEMAREVARQALDTRTSFFTSMNHDFRAPLNSIIGFSDLMRAEKLGAHAVPQYQEYSEYIHDAGMLLLNSVNRMMDISTIMSDSEIRVREQIFSVLPEIGAAVQLSNGHSTARSRNIIVSVPEEIREIAFDPLRFTHLLHNLLTNAIKYSPEDTQITVSMELLESGEAVLSVVDEGFGLEQREITRITDTFVRSKDTRIETIEGFGLGLSIVKSIADAHNCSLKIDSEIGVGTQVSLTLPASRVNPGSEEILGSEPRAAIQAYRSSPTSQTFRHDA